MIDELEIGDCVRIDQADGLTFRGVVSQVADNCIWIMDGDIYWRDNGENVAGANGTRKVFSRISVATLDELEPLLDISVLA